MAVFLIAILVPVLWTIIWFILSLGYRLPKWSWFRLPLILLGLSVLPATIIAQSQLLRSFVPAERYKGTFDKVFFPELFLTIALVFWRIASEEKAKKRPEQ